LTFIAWIVIGGVLGWLASIVMKTDAQQSDFSIGSLFVSFLGAVDPARDRQLLPPAAERRP
jgi:uncharacterized membrane protein YeaQ/YmgE (transglycosylase-associated protein family)